MFQFAIGRTDRQLLPLFTHRLDIHCNADTVFQSFIRFFQQEESKVECFLKADATMAHRTIVSRESPPGRSIVQIYGMRIRKAEDDASQ